MFIDEKTQNRIHANLGEGVSHGTMRCQDLIPAFMDVLRDTPEYVQLMNVVPTYASEDENSDWWNSENAAMLLKLLSYTLDSYAPESYSFGEHPDDKANYGYWKMVKTKNKMTLEKLKEEYFESEVCMGEMLLSMPADGLSLEEAFELNIAAKKWADGDRFYRIIDDGEQEELGDV